MNDERWYTLAPGQWENDDGPKDWWAIVDDEVGGIVAYAFTEGYAYQILHTLRQEK